MARARTGNPAPEAQMDGHERTGTGGGNATKFGREFGSLAPRVQSPNWIPRSLADSTVSQSSGTVFMRSTAALSGS
jgi:hypothetical protein